MKINSRGYWENNTVEGHGHDEGLSKALVEFFMFEKKPDELLNIMDVGCGDGYYLRAFNSLPYGIMLCHGYDGNPNTQFLAGANSFVMDFSKPTLLSEDIKYSWVLCLEVGEHIPSEYENVFLYNLDKHNKYGIILSWAVRGQGGDGHVNCLDNWEVIERVEAMGYTLDMESTTKLRLSCAEYPDTGWWFRQTLMCFRKNK